jgi:hypothetical protein
MPEQAALRAARRVEDPALHRSALLLAFQLLFQQLVNQFGIALAFGSLH